MRNLVPHFVHRQFKRGTRAGTFPAATLFADISGFTALTEKLTNYGKDGAEALGETLHGIFVPLVREVYARGGLVALFSGDAFTALFPYGETAAGAGSEGDAASPAATTASVAALHAIQTAAYIQAHFAPGGRDRVFATRFGDFALGVKVGVSCGDVQWGIPGHGGRYTFYFRGPGVTGCARAEMQANRGQVIADRALLPHIQAQVDTEPIAGTRCHRVVSPYRAVAGHQAAACSPDLPAPGAELPAFSRDDLRPFIPDTVLELSLEAEFREVCPVFISFEELVDEAGLHRFLAEIIALADDFGGNLGQVEFGDKGGLLVLWFGAPTAYENNAQRAVEFLLACQRRGWTPRWRAGLASGIVWAGFRGGFERCEYSIVGDVVNLAARLAMAAGWGETWASPLLRAGLAATYRFAPRGAVRLMGRSGEIAVWELQGKRVRAEPRFHTRQIIGRDAELNLLAAHLEPIFGGRFAGLIYVHGEAGVGKSCLVHELRQKAEQRGVRWFLCPADQILQKSLNPFRSFLRRYLDQDRSRVAEENIAHLDATLDELSAHLHGVTAYDKGRSTALAGDLQRTRSFLAALINLRWDGSLYEQLDPRLRFDNMLAAFKTLILAECVRQPVVVQLEDLHWLDDDSKELVELLTRNVEEYPLALVCTSRYLDDGSRVALHVEAGAPQNSLDLNTLGQEDIGRLATLILQGGISDELAALLEEKTGGNPFYIEQLALDLREQGALSRQAKGLWSVSAGRVVEVPATIGAVLIARLDRLVAQVREVVQTASVLGREFELQALSRMLGDDERVPEWVEDAEEKWIWTVVSEVRYLFRHALLRDAAYDMQLQARLRELHALAGVAIEQLYQADLAPHYAELAYHFGQAGKVGRERTYAQLAGQQAASQFANEQARRHFDRALALTPEEDLRARYDLTLARQKVCDLQADRAAQARDLAVLEALAEGLADDQLGAEVALWQSDYGESTGDYAASMEAAQKAISLALAAGDMPQEAMGFRQWGRAHWRLADYDEAHTLLEAALQRAQDAGLVAVEAETLHDLGLSAHHQGAETKAKACLERALQLFTRLNDRRGEGRARNSLGLVQRTQGDYGRALASHEQALLAFHEIGDRRGEAMVLNNLGVISRLRGEYDQARTFYAQAIDIQREIGDRWNAAVSLNNLGNVVRDMGDYVAAEAIHVGALHEHQEIGNRHGEDIALENLGNDALHQGNYAQARSYFERSLAICTEVGDAKGQAYEHCYLGVVARSLGEYDEAGTCFRRALQLCGELQYPRGRAFALVAQSLLRTQVGDYPSAAEDALQALAIMQELGFRTGQGAAHLCLGHAQAGLGQPDRASTTYQEALVVYRELGETHRAMEPLAGLARASLALGNLARAQDCVEEILGYVREHSLPGGGEPLRTYLTCYQVLSASDDPRARDVLSRANALLQEQAAKIEDADARRTFLKNVAAHREIEAAYTNA